LLKAFIWDVPCIPQASGKGRMGGFMVKMQQCVKKTSVKMPKESLENEGRFPLFYGAYVAISLN
jgi:hypothetical protein